MFWWRSAQGLTTVLLERLMNLLPMRRLFTLTLILHLSVRASEWIYRLWAMQKIYYKNSINISILLREKNGWIKSNTGKKKIHYRITTLETLLNRNT